jgi:hypothetical protein
MEELYASTIDVSRLADVMAAGAPIIGRASCNTFMATT